MEHRSLFKNLKFIMFYRFCEDVSLVVEFSILFLKIELYPVVETNHLRAVSLSYKHVFEPGAVGLAAMTRIELEPDTS